MFKIECRCELCLYCERAFIASIVLLLYGWMRCLLGCERYVAESWRKSCAERVDLGQCVSNKVYRTFLYITSVPIIIWVSPVLFVIYYYLVHV